MVLGVSLLFLYKGILCFRSNLLLDDANIEAVACFHDSSFYFVVCSSV